MAAYTNPQGNYCPHCGTSLDPAALVCSHCHKFTHARELEDLSSRARQLTAAAQLVAARDCWAAALKLLPPDSSEHAGVEREIQKLNARISPPAATDWKKRLGPFGVALAALAKYKTFLLVLLTKGKFLFSILLFFGMYWTLFGWWFALGLTGSVFLHEMGHYLMARRFGFAAELPMFIPGLGAYVKWNGAGVEPGIRAQISLAGPFFGFLSGLIAYGIYLSTGQPVWLALAHFAGWINLLNLIPVFIFDGASAMHALGVQGRAAVALVSIVMFFTLKELLFLVLAVAAGYRWFRRDFPAEPKESIAYAYVGLVLGNGFLSWFALNQARTLFER